MPRERLRRTYGRTSPRSSRIAFLTYKIARVLAMDVDERLNYERRFPPWQPGGLADAEGARVGPNQFVAISARM